MEVACREKTEKFTPWAVMLAPNGNGFPGAVRKTDESVQAVWVGRGLVVDWQLFVTGHQSF